MDDVTEVWRDVVGYEGLYEVSDRGQVRSLDRWVRCGETAQRLVPGQTMATFQHTSGYPMVQLSGRPGDRRHLVHVLVLKAFKGPCPDGQEGLHWDDDSNNNSLANLRWGTRSENRNDAVRNKTDVNARKTECPKGHELTPSPYEKNKRWCHECVLENNRRYRAKKKLLSQGSL
jgi:hypothetical protein